MNGERIANQGERDVGMTAGERKKHFAEYLLKKYSERKVDEIIAALERAESYMVKKKQIEGCLYAVADSNICHHAMASTTKNRFFRLLNRKIYPSIDLGMQEYIAFLQIQEQAEKQPFAEGNTEEEYHRGAQIDQDHIVDEGTEEVHPSVLEKDVDREKNEQVYLSDERNPEEPIAMQELQEGEQEKEHTEIENVAVEKAAIEGDNAGIQNDFFIWMLKEKRHVNLNELKDIYARIESFCVRSKILQTSLFQTTDLDVLQKVKCAVESSKTLYSNTSNRKKFVSAMECYIAFLSQKDSHTTEENIEITAEKNPAEEKPKRSPVWNEEEIQLLLDTVRRIHDDEIDKQDAVRELSRKLRAIAEKDYSITPEFRDEKSVEERLGEIEYHFTNGKSGIENASGLLKSAVREYQKKRSDDLKTSEEEQLEPKKDDEAPNDTEASKLSARENASPQVSPISPTKVDGILARMRDEILHDNVDYWFEQYVKENRDAALWRRSILSMWGPNNRQVGAVERSVQSCGNRQYKQLCDFLSWCAETDQHHISTNPIKRENATTSVSNSSEPIIDIRKERKAFSDWMLRNGMSEGGTNVYLTAINRCSEFAVENEIAACNLYLLSNPDELSAIRDAVIPLLDKRQFARFQSPLNKYISFRRATAAKIGNTASRSGGKKKRQPLWDQYEAAVLLAAYLDVQAGKLSRQDAIKRVSVALRRRAALMGYEVDDRFRNIAGITMQMRSMEFCATYGKHGLSNPSALFQETVRLYRTDREKYRKLLMEVQKQTGETFSDDAPRDELESDHIDETSSSVLSELLSALGDRASHMVITYVIAYTQDTDVRQELLSYWDNAEATIRSIHAERLEAPGEEGDTQRKQFETVCDFLRWCAFDLDEEIHSFAEGALGDHPESIHDLYEKNQILSKIAAVRDGDMILTPTELAEYFGKDTARILELLRQCKNGTFTYDEFTDTFIVNDETLSDRVQKYLKELPDVFNRSSLPHILKQAEEKEGISPEIMELAIKQSFIPKMKQYRRKWHAPEETIRLTDDKPDGIVEWLIGHDISYIDNRHKSGALWMIGGKEMQDIVKMFKRHHVRFSFIKNGGTTTKGQSAWWTDDTVSYSISDEAKKKSASAGMPISKTEDELVHVNRVAFIDWMRTNQDTNGDVFLTLSMLRQCEQYAKAAGYLSESIFTISNVRQLQTLARQLVKNKSFRADSNAKNGVLEKSLQKYISFCKKMSANLSKQVTAVSKNGTMKTSVPKTASESPKQVKSLREKSIETASAKPQQTGKYYDLLKEKFSKGFRAESRLDLRKFRKAYTIQYGQEPDASDEEILAEIQKVTIRHEKMLYLPDMMLGEEKKQKLLAYIEKLFSEGKAAIYYTALFEEFSDDFLGERIHNAEILKTYLEYINDGRFYVNRVYIAKDRNVRVEPLDEVLEALRQNPAEPMTVDQLCENLPHLPRDVITKALKNSEDIICNKRGESFFHISALDLDDSEMEDIARIIQNGIDTHHFITNSELQSAIKTMYPDILERYEAFSSIGFRDAIALKLRGRFTFHANIITAKGTVLTTSDVFANFCKTHDHFTMGELNLLREDLGSVIYFETVYENALRISQNEFVSFDTVSFDVPGIDEAIGQYCKSDYISLHEIDDFGSFPYVGVAWNAYLLEHYVADFSYTYQLLHTGFNAASCVGAIVRRDSGIETFDQLLIRVLADSGHVISTTDALDYLIEMGYLAGRGYKRIDRIVIDAKVQRSGKG